MNLRIAAKDRGPSSVLLSFIVLFFTLVVSSQNPTVATTSTVATPTISSAPSSIFSSVASLNPSVPVTPTVLHDVFQFSTSCDQTQRDLVTKAFNDAKQMSNLASQSWKNYYQDPAFWDLFGTRALTNQSSIQQNFDKIFGSAWNITAICDLYNSNPKCTDRYMYGGIGEDSSDAAQADFSATLIFCREFFSFPPLDARLQMGLNHQYDWTVRLNLGFYHENQGKLSSSGRIKFR